MADGLAPRGCDVNVHDCHEHTASKGRARVTSGLQTSISDYGWLPAQAIRQNPSALSNANESLMSFSPRYQSRPLVVGKPLRKLTTRVANRFLGLKVRDGR